MTVQRVCSNHGIIGCDCQTKDNRPSFSRRGYGLAWQRTRKAYARAHPYCQRCGQLFPEGKGLHVHHKDGQGPRGNNDPANLAGLCPSCHSKITAKEQPGGWNT